MSKKLERHSSTISVLFVGPGSDSLRRKAAALERAGFDVTLAETICHAEMFAEVRFFDLAVYDDTLAALEQLSLAGVMRVRWPWMRLVSCGNAPADARLDAQESSEAQLAETLRKVMI